MAIFCHGGKDQICDLSFRSFFPFILNPIRASAEQLLILDTTCQSEFHKNEYQKRAKKSGRKLEFEVYLSQRPSSSICK